jgi:hypothetical protein
VKAARKADGEETGARVDGAPASPLPGFAARPDSTEQAIEGTGVAEARNATEDLPRQA